MSLSWSICSILHQVVPNHLQHISEERAKSAMSLLLFIHSSAIILLLTAPTLQSVEAMQQSHRAHLFSVRLQPDSVSLKDLFYQEYK